MKHRIAGLAALVLLLGTTTAPARDLPADVVKTSKDFFLLGQPKRVLTQAS